jgi:hypothetical protein
MISDLEQDDLSPNYSALRHIYYFSIVAPTIQTKLSFLLTAKHTTLHPNVSLSLLTECYDERRYRLVGKPSSWLLFGFCGTFLRIHVRRPY